MIGWKVPLCALSVMAGAALLMWAVWPSPRPADPAASARQYLDASACLLTGAQGVTGGPQAAAWLGTEDASLATHARVQYLAVRGPATKANALPYLASLLQRRCDVVIAVGSAQAAAAVAEAGRFPSVRFITVGAPDGPAGPVAGVTTVAAPAGQVRAAVNEAVAAALSQEGVLCVPGKRASPGPR